MNICVSFEISIEVKLKEVKKLQWKSNKAKTLPCPLLVWPTLTLYKVTEVRKYNTNSPQVWDFITKIHFNLYDVAKCMKKKTKQTQFKNQSSFLI